MQKYGTISEQMPTTRPNFVNHEAKNERQKTNPKKMHSTAGCSGDRYSQRRRLSVVLLEELNELAALGEGMVWEDFVELGLFGEIHLEAWREGVVVGVLEPIVLG